MIAIIAITAVVPNTALIFLLKFVINVRFGILKFNYDKTKDVVLREIKNYCLFFSSVIS